VGKENIMDAEGNATTAQAVMEAGASEMPDKGGTPAEAGREPQGATGAGQAGKPDATDPDGLLAEMGLKEKEKEPEPENDENAGLSDELKAKIQKRIDKEIAKRKALEEKLASQQTELEGIRKAAPGKPTPVFEARDAGEIRERQEKLLNWKAWLIENIEGYEGDGTANDPSYAAKEIRKRLAEVESELAIAIPRAHELLRERKASEELTKAAYPGWDRPESKTATEVERILNEVPQLRAYPAAKMLILDAFAGRLLRERRTRTGPGREPPPLRTATAGAKGAGATERPARTGINNAVFAKKGYTREALEEALGG